jgi:hypothetical protein
MTEDAVAQTRIWTPDARMIDPNDFARRARGRPAPSPLATAIG